MKLKVLGLSLLLACAGMQAHAVGRMADVSVVDRDSGATLPTYYYRGETWVAGRPGARYAVAVRNKLGERVLAVTSVDGVNVLSGETAAWDQTGYVFGSYLQYQITGWRKSSSEVAAFEFSAAGDSYAGRTGRPENVGVIGVALFREKQPEPVAQAPSLFRRNEADSGQASARAKSAPAPASPSQADRADAPAAMGSLSLTEKQAKAAGESMPSPKLGTGYGQRETSVVQHTGFERLQPQPNEVIRIRYDSRENLIASGVIREPVARPTIPGVNPFPQSDQTSYVPDPPVRRY